jgi:hypothetical protein
MAVQQTTTETILPQWYTEYAQKLMGRGLAASEEPYQAYGLPRIAGFAPEQEQAFAMAPEAAASYRPYLGTAGTFATAGGAGSAYSEAQPFLARGAGSFTAPGVAQQYMNPYIQQVVSGIGDIAGRNLRENILPAVNRTFIGGGTFGGSRSAEFTNRAVRDAQSAALSQQIDALRQGYGQAADLYGAEAGRSLTAAGQAGSLAGSDYSRMLDAAQRLGILGESAQGMGLKEAGALEAIGSQRRGLAQTSADLAYQDFQAQRDYPFTQLQKLSGVAGTPSATGSSTVQSTPGPSKTTQTLGALAGIAGILGSSGAFGSGGWLGLKDGGSVGRKVPKMKSGLGWLKDKN